MSFFDKIRVYMSLHDVSKHDDQRLDPKANASDTRAQRDATNTTSIHPVTDATTTKGFLKTGSGQILGNDGSNNVGLFGFDSTGTMVVKVAKAGFDANTAANANLVFNSAQNVFKVVVTGTITGNTIVAGASETLTVAHGLAIPPMTMAFFNGGTFFYPLPFAPNQTFSAGGNVVNNTYCYCTADATNIYITSINGSGITRGPYTFRYYALQETAAS